MSDTTTNYETENGLSSIFPTQEEVDNESSVEEKLFAVAVLGAAVTKVGPLLFEIGVRASHDAMMMRASGQTLEGLHLWDPVRTMAENPGALELVAMSAVGGGALAATGALGVGAYKLGKPYVISLKKDIMKAFDKVSQYIQGNTAEGVPKSYAKNIKNVHAVLRLMDKKGQESYLVGRVGEKTKVVDNKGMTEFVKSLGDEPCMYVGKADGDIVVSTIKHDASTNEPQVGHLVVTSEKEFAKDIESYTDALAAQYEKTKKAEAPSPSDADLKL